MTPKAIQQLLLAFLS